MLAYIISKPSPSTTFGNSHNCNKPDLEFKGHNFSQVISVPQKIAYQYANGKHFYFLLKNNILKFLVYIFQFQKLYSCFFYESKFFHFSHNVLYSLI